MTVDLNNLKNYALSKKKLFKRLAEKLKKLNNQKVDKFFHEFHYNEFEEINCLDCASCCKGLGPRLTQKDIERLASYLKIKNSDFFDLYLKIDEDKDYVFKSMPCPFLMDDNMCMVYESRPKTCREYPHTNQKNIKSILHLCVKNTETCPVVYNIFNKIESEMKI